MSLFNILRIPLFELPTVISTVVQVHTEYLKLGVIPLQESMVWDILFLHLFNFILFHFMWLFNTAFKISFPELMSNREHYRIKMNHVLLACAFFPSK